MPTQATVTILNINQTYDSLQKSVTVTTNPVGLTTNVVYSGDRINAGTCPVSATIVDSATYQRSALVNTDTYMDAVNIGDGKLYLIPYGSQYVGIYNISTGQYSRGVATGESANAYATGAYLNNGKILFIPFNSNYFAFYDIAANTITKQQFSNYAKTQCKRSITIGNKIIIPVCQDFSFYGYVGIYDIANTSFSRGANHTYISSFIHSSCVLMNDGNICFVPSRCPYIEIYNPTTNQITVGPNHNEGDYAFQDGLLLSNGKILLIPQRSSYFGLYDPSNNSYTRTFQHNLGNNAFGGAVKLTGTKYCISPYNATNVWIYDESDDSYTPSSSISETAPSFVNCTKLDDNLVALIPYSSTYIGLYGYTYYGSASATLTINKQPATVTITNLNQIYNGLSKSVTVTTDPQGLNVDTTYNGSSSQPINIGNYNVVSTVNEQNYEGSSNATLIISKSSNRLTLSNMHRSYDAVQKKVETSTKAPDISDYVLDPNYTPKVVAFGFSSHGLNNEIVDLKDLDDLDLKIGKPNNEAERYLYYGCKELLKNGHQIYVGKLPYINEYDNFSLEDERKLIYNTIYVSLTNSPLSANFPDMSYSLSYDSIDSVNKIVRYIYPYQPLDGTDCIELQYYFDGKLKCCGLGKARQNDWYFRSRAESETLYGTTAELTNLQYVALGISAGTFEITQFSIY